MVDANTQFRIIVIDDNPAIHQDFIKILMANKATDAASEIDLLNLKMFGKKATAEQLDQFEIDTASQGQEGVTKIKEALAQGRPYSLAFVDIRMPPGWDGIETIKHIWELDKDIQIVICTAYSDYSWEDTIAHLGKTDNLLILKKPFDNVSVRQLTCALTKKWQLLLDSRRYTSSLKDEVEDRTLSLQKSLSLVRATLESSNDGILVINRESDVIDYNQRFLSMWQIPRKFLQEANNKNKILEHMKALLENPEDFYSILNGSDASKETNIYVIKFKDGRIFESYSQPQLLNNKSVGDVFNFSDVTKRAKLEKDLQHQATHDILTGLPNRVMLHNRIRNEIATASQNNTIFAVIFLDLDRFKLINDSLSHAVGDELLLATAMRLQSMVRPEDTLARLGGDEFVIMLANFTSEEDIISRAKNILAIFQEPFRIEGRTVTVTSSMGISLYPKDGNTIDVLLRNADAAMYQAKENGSNNFQFYTDEMSSKSLAKLDGEMELRHAMANGELYLCYQPQLDIDQSKLIAAEALMRWQHPQKGVLLPMEFIPIAEETGLIVPLGEWSIRTACLQCKSWQDQGFSPIRVAVNVSSQQLKQQNFVEMVREILIETKLPPEYLELELTENVIISNVEVIEIVTRLKELGIEISIDDFGTGYSSLSYLRKLPLDRLKIDCSFIQNIKSAGDDEVIIRAIISVAKNLNLNVLAEGVETQNQLDYLKDNECNEIQGYYYSKPLSVTELEALLKSDKKGKCETDKVT